MSNKLILSTILCMVLFLSCASQKPEEKVAAQTKVQETDKSASSISVINFSGFVPKKINIDPFMMKNIEAGFPKFLSRDMDQRVIETYYHARTDEVCLHYQFETSKNELYFSNAARVMARNAVDLYIADYNNKALIKDEYKTRYEYGKQEGRLRWGAFQIRANSEPELQYGYKFSGDNPYFVIVVKAADNLDSNSYDKIPGSIEMTLYFTIAQAKALSEVFDYEYIKTELAKQDIPEASSVPDEY